MTAFVLGPLYTKEFFFVYVRYVRRCLLEGKEKATLLLLPCAVVRVFASCSDKSVTVS